MITEDEYKKAQAIVDQYHLERQQEAEWDLQDEDEEDEEDIMERREYERYERALNCSCGAWCLSSDKTKVLHVADCICGAE